MFNANYMIGSVSVGLILMESNGSGRNWNEYEKDTAAAAMVKACELLWMHSEPYNIDLRWYYHIYGTVPTGYEPILTDYPKSDLL